jgi:site-specific recombinase XerD
MPIHLHPVSTEPAEPDLDRRGYPRSPVTRSSYRKGKPNPWKGRTHPAEPLTPDEVWRLIKACKQTPTGRRDAALIMLYWRSGLRCSEGLSLFPKDLDLDKGVITVLHGKGNKRRVVAFDPEACAFVAEWMEYRATRFDRSATVFPVMNGPTKGRELGSAYVRQALVHLQLKTGIEKRVRPHALRHSYACYLLDNGVPMHYIQRMLGHSNINVTQRYADHINPAAVIAEMLKLEWPTAA